MLSECFIENRYNEVKKKSPFKGLLLLTFNGKYFYSFGDAAERVSDLLDIPTITHLGAKSCSFEMSKLRRKKLGEIVVAKSEEAYG